MTRVLILDDDTIRLQTLKAIAKKDFDASDITLVKTAKKAISALGKSSFDVIFLDHDLGGMAYVDSNEENTGYQVAKFIEENNLKFERIIIHTMNIKAADLMEAALKNQGPISRIPFIFMI